jgi:hypothetical protein
MRTIRVAVAALLLLAISGAWPQQAAAGGPTSVLLAAPQHGRVAALGYDDPRYQELAEQVGAFEGKTEPADPVAGGDAWLAQVRLTWLIHDMLVWRIDFIHIRASGRWVIETREIGPDGSQGDSRFHRATDLKALKSLLAGLGMLSADGGTSDAGGGRPGLDGPVNPQEPVSGDRVSTGDDRTNDLPPGAEPGRPAGGEAAANSAGGTSGWLGLVGAGIGGLVVGGLGYHLATGRRSGRIELTG